MNIFLCNNTALTLWRTLGNSIPRPTSRRVKLSAKSPDVKTAERIVSSLGCSLDGDIDILVPSAEARRFSTGLRCHVWSSDLPPRSFSPIKDGARISSPEFLFLQMATCLSLVKLIELGFELCGTYALSPSNPQGFEKRSPLTTKESIADYLRTCPSAKGIKKARKAIRHVINGSASPMETILAMMLCLPPRLGGYGFPPASMNQSLQLSLKDAEGKESERTVRCDLFWPPSLAIEYESDAEHLSSHKYSQDSIRRNDIESANVTVLTVTKHQLLNRGHWPDIAGRVASLMSRRTRIGARNHAELQRDLYAQLLGHLFSADRPGDR